jgi:hypothetical protein
MAVIKWSRASRLSNKITLFLFRSRRDTNQLKGGLLAESTSVPLSGELPERRQGFIWAGPDEFIWAGPNELPGPIKTNFTMGGRGRHS